jgi:sarcosine oxidase subunit beta
VVLIERKFVASGPTGRSTALVRRFYAMDFFTRTGSAAADVFQRWEEVIGGDPGYRQVGVLVVAGPADAGHLERNARRAQALGAKVRLITPAEVAALVPEMATDDLALASYEAESGYADPASTANALVDRARQLGAVVLQYRRVEAILTAGGRVTGVRLEGGGEIAAPVVVDCAGLWAARLLAPLGIAVEVRPTRHQMCFFRRPGGFTTHPAVADRVHQTYLRPEHGDLMIFGLTRHEEVVDPDAYNEGADPDVILQNAQRIAARFPVMEHGLAMGGYSGVYDVTPDHQPVLGPIPEYAGLHANFGWSGHGFKHSPVIGDILSDVILTGQAAGWDLTPFRWSRFREGDLLPPGHWTAPPHDRLRDPALAGRP